MIKSDLPNAALLVVNPGILTTFSNSLPHGHFPPVDRSLKTSTECKNATLNPRKKLLLANVFINLIHLKTLVSYDI